MEISIIIPAYNEELRISKTLTEFYNYFSKKYSCEFIVVCDGNTDKTPEIVASFSKKHTEVKLLTFPKKLGKGGGVLEGMKAAHGFFIGFVDSDLSITPEDFEKLLKKIKHEEIDGVIASRRAEGAKILIKQPFYRRFLSFGWNLLVRTMFFIPFTDTQCGAKIFKGSVLKKIIPNLKTRGFEFDVELLWRFYSNGFKVVEVPINWTHKELSTFRISDIIGMLFSLVKVRIFG